VPALCQAIRIIVAEIRRPPVLRCRHHLRDVFLYGVEIERLELFGVVEVAAHRIARRRTLMEDLQVQLIRPPFLVRHAAVRFG
jgi:hypothetical protein